MSEINKELKEELLADKESRHAYFNELLNIFIATQLKVLREQRELTQEQLAKDAKGLKGFGKEDKEMKQERISTMENVNYSSWSINTLRKLAWAFDLRLKVSFEEFGTGLREAQYFSREFLERRSVRNDPYFKLQTISGEADGNKAIMRRNAAEINHKLQTILSSQSHELFMITDPTSATLSRVVNR
ncbi:hypothetical protein EPN95_04695 [Patescibacteria group bacterium]|nr:MAG: hypothetical protein EPN95_04695 [Patescibacteria group bacterium]